MHAAGRNAHRCNAEGNTYFSALHAYLGGLKTKEVVASVGVQRVIPCYATLLTPIHEVEVWLEVWDAIFEACHGPAAQDWLQFSSIERKADVPSWQGSSLILGSWVQRQPCSCDALHPNLGVSGGHQ